MDVFSTSTGHREENIGAYSEHSKDIHLWQANKWGKDKSHKMVWMKFLKVY